MPLDVLAERFADLTVRAGANVQPGQHVYIAVDLAHAEVARAVVEQAYAAGASYVEVDWADGLVKRSSAEHASLESLTVSRSWMLDRYQSLDRDAAAVILLVGDPYPGLMNGLEAHKVAAFRAEEETARRQMFVSGRATWTIAAVPNAGWARQVFGEPDVDRLWQAVSVAMRLDEPDPVGAWRERSATLEARAKALDVLELTALRYLGEGTDLTVGLMPGTRWTGGGMTTTAGIAYVPNLPTEEVFTSPDRRIADGVIALTRPLVMQNGGIVEGLRVTFEAGRIVNVQADSGIDLVRGQLSTDEGASSLGEVSLVDSESRIAKANLVFHNTLFDENAACHVAWGQAFPFALANGLAMSPDERYEAGLNRSAVHTDVVIGGNGITVTGTGPGGTVEIIKNDEWVLGG